MFIRNGENDHKNCVKGSFSIKLTKIGKENQGWNVLYIRGHDVTDAWFRTLLLHNFVRTDQKTAKLWTRLFFHKIIKQGWIFGIRSPSTLLKLDGGATTYLSMQYLSILFQSKQWKHQDNLWNLFEVKNKDTITTSLALFWCLYW